MQRASTRDFCFLLCMITPQLVCGADIKLLSVGEELQKETILFHSGSRIYRLQGLGPNTWYEVKISYPASIPASFSLQLDKGHFDSVLKPQRKLLNTEKLIFKNDDVSNQDGMCVILTVEPEGVVAIPHRQEMESVIYNIVCDELMLGIPHEAWWVVILVILCLGAAFVIPSFLPLSFINPNTGRMLRSTPKISRL